LAIMPHHLVNFKRFLIIASLKLKQLMGRGDKKTAKGKRTKGSFGVSRNKKAIKVQLKRSASKKTVAPAAAAAPAPKKRTVKKKTES